LICNAVAFLDEELKRTWTLLPQQRARFAEQFAVDLILGGLGIGVDSRAQLRLR
jgi:hypothetical protein